MTRILTPISTSWIDYPSNDDYCLTVVMMGCDNSCPRCQNPQFKNPDFNYETTEYDVDSLINELIILSKRNKTNKVVLSGGDPISCFNKEFTKSLLNKGKELFDFCIYTGHDIEYVKENNINGFTFIKCGIYDHTKSQESEKTDEYMQFASINQQLFDSKYCLLSQDGIYYFK